MRWLDGYLMRRAARAMAHRLPPVLAREWGSGESYTAQQVRRALRMTRLAGRYEFIALAAFLDRQTYETVVGAKVVARYGYDAPRDLFELERPIALTGTSWPSPIPASNTEAARKYGHGARL